MEKSELQKDKILKVAQSMFSEQGFEATTTREISREAGISDGSLYYYFPDGKREILDTIVHQGIESRTVVIDDWFSEIKTVSDLEQQIINLYERICLIFEDEDSYRSFMITIRERPLLTDSQSDWLLEILNNIRIKLVKELDLIKDLLNISSKNFDDTVGIIISIIQKSIYDELVLKNNKVISDEVKRITESEISLMTKLITKEDTSEK
ncbi:TetR/AcrR family transcriptional regulator [Companilactobacillus baiquanensis]|uniref:TetR/AcrR family transcriptional regulator n=1 Tax=Companilactobacillus baiquanensis TaxID=2486005 RepID=A0ABW1UXU5_9LACO|nr:TetR/AcrR family transcriptional regulator [Companilactobacillus baiquanensis]